MLVDGRGYVVVIVPVRCTVWADVVRTVKAASKGIVFSTPYHAWAQTLPPAPCCWLRSLFAWVGSFYLCHRLGNNTHSTREGVYAMWYQQAVCSYKQTVKRQTEGTHDCTAAQQLLTNNCDESPVRLVLPKTTGKQQTEKAGLCTVCGQVGCKKVNQAPAHIKARVEV